MRRALSKGARNRPARRASGVARVSLLRLVTRLRKIHAAEADPTNGYSPRAGARSARPGITVQRLPHLETMDGTRHGGVDFDSNTLAIFADFNQSNLPSRPEMSPEPLLKINDA